MGAGPAQMGSTARKTIGVNAAAFGQLQHMMP